MNQPWVYTCPHPEYPSQFPSHPIPQGCPRAPALSALFQASYTLRHSHFTDEETEAQRIKLLAKKHIVTSGTKLTTATSSLH